MDKDSENSRDDEERMRDRPSKSRAEQEGVLAKRRSKADTSAANRRPSNPYSDSSGDDNGAKRRDRSPSPVTPLGSVSLELNMAEQGQDILPASASYKSEASDQDVSAKRREKNAVPASHPGAVSSSSAGRSQQEKSSVMTQVMAQQDKEARPTGDSIFSDARGRLGRLEDESMAENRAEAGDVPFAVDAHAYTFHCEGEALAKIHDEDTTTGAPGAAAASAPRRGLESFENDVLATIRARTSYVARASHAARARANLSEVETEVLANNHVGASSITSMSSIASMKSMSSAPDILSGVHNLENQVLTKTGSSPRIGGSSSSRNTGIAATAAQATPGYDDGFGEPVVFGRSPNVSRYGGSSRSFAINQRQSERSLYYGDDWNESVRTAAVVQAPVVPMEGYPSLDFRIREVPESVGESGGIQAFVSDDVVDATGVAVLPTKEEQEKQMSRQYCCKLTLVALFVLLVAITIVIPVIAVSGRARSTPGPTWGPTMQPTSIPTTSNFFQSVQYLVSQQIAPAEAFADTKSPQYKALQFIAVDDPNGLSDIGSRDYMTRYALAVFYYSLNGDMWDRCDLYDRGCGSSAWLTGDHCEWSGVECVDGVVTGIVFEYSDGNDLSGTLASELAILTDLTNILLPHDDITGSIPEEIGLLTKLVGLTLTNNHLTGEIPELLLTNTPLLGTLVLSENNFTGPMPVIQNNPNLHVYRISDNSFSGPLSPDLGTNTNLLQFSIYGNSFNGQIPKEYFSLSDLREFLLDDNALIGVFPAKVTQLTKLSKLGLSFNDFSGELPDSLGNLQELVLLDLGGNKFKGKLPETLRQLTNMRIMTLNYNEFTGTVPTSISEMQKLNELFLEGNEFWGNISAEICSRKGLSAFSLKDISADCDEVSCSCCNC